MALPNIPAIPGLPPVLTGQKPGQASSVAAGFTDNSAPAITDPSKQQFFTKLSANSINGSLWNINFPFQLWILNAMKGSYSPPQYTFTLPIGPESLSITTPFAITTDVTLDGIVEQHNGTPIKNISLQGSFGVYPLRPHGPAMDVSSQVMNFSNAILAGNISPRTQAAGILGGANVAQAAVANFVGAASTSNNFLTDAEIDAQGTGYYQFRLLEQFLENYTALKRDPANKNLRLAFVVLKQEAAYLVTPVNFEVRRSQESPYEYSYSLQFTAWRRFEPDLTTTAYQDPSVLPSNTLASVLDRCLQAASFLSGAYQVMQSMVASYNDTVGEPLRQAIVFCQDATGSPPTLAQYPAAVIPQLPGLVVPQYPALQPSITATDSDTVAVDKAIVQANNDVTSGVLTIQQLATNSPVAKIFNDNAAKHYNFFASLPSNQLNLPTPLLKLLQLDRATIKLLTRQDFEDRRDAILNFAADYADRVGLGSTDYDATFGRPSLPAARQPIDTDYDILYVLNDLAVQFSIMAAYVDINPSLPKITTIQAVAGIAQAAGMTFPVPVSKFAVPFPYGATLEMLAAQYLGDPNRWMEIAALNNLLAPYVDEVGVDYPVLTNSIGNVVTIQDASALYLGQAVTLYNTTTGQTTAHITQLTPVGAGPDYWAVSLDVGDLDDYSVSLNSQLHGYLPNTVNSQQVIYIPSQSPAGADGTAQETPGVNDIDHLLNIAGVDILLTPTFDLAVTPDGDCRASFGLTNLVQQAKIVLSTVRGSVPQHQDFGAGIPVGLSTADFNAQTLLANYKQAFSQDPSFQGVSRVVINQDGPVATVSLELQPTGANQNIPISATVQRS